MTIRINVAISNTPPAAPATMGTTLNPGDPLRNKETENYSLSRQSKIYMQNGNHCQHLEVPHYVIYSTNVA